MKPYIVVSNDLSSTERRALQQQQEIDAAYADIAANQWKHELADLILLTCEWLALVRDMEVEDTKAMREQYIGDLLDAGLTPQQMGWVDHRGRP